MNKNYLRILIVLALVVTSCEYAENGMEVDRTPASQTIPSTSPTPSPTPKSTPKPSPTPSAPVSGSAKPLWESANSDGVNWTAHVMSKLDTLGVDMVDSLPADFKTFCPKYDKLTYTQKKEFFTYLMSAMTKYESTFDPTEFYREAFNDSSGNPVISRGLLQISIESANSYGCGFTNAQQLHDPYLNLNCGMRILNRWIGQRDFRIAGKVNDGWKGGARYWSVLRTTSGSYAKIVALTNSTSLCKL